MKKATSIDNLSVQSAVFITPKPEHIHHLWKQKEFCYEGIVRNIRYSYINKGAKHWGKEKNVYVSLLSTTAYNNLLMKGSMIFCNINNVPFNCYISEIEKDANNSITKLEVCMYDDENLHDLNARKYTITVDHIESILITDTAFTFSKL
jgi:hypothetical protein